MGWSVSTLILRDENKQVNTLIWSYFGENNESFPLPMSPKYEISFWPPSLMGCWGHLLISLNWSLKLEKTPNQPPTPPAGDKKISQLNHVGSLLNFQDIFPIIYWQSLWCKRWPNSLSLHLGTLSILQVQNLARYIYYTYKYLRKLDFAEHLLTQTNLTCKS